MPNGYYSTKQLRNRLIKDIKQEIKLINSDIDTKLLALSDNYTDITDNANAIYEDLCSIFNEINKMNLSQNNLDEHLFNSYFYKLEDIKNQVISLKENDLIGMLLTENLKTLIQDDLRKIKYIELDLKKFDKKAAIIAGSISIQNVLKKINDYCNDIISDFIENHETKITELIIHIIENNITPFISFCNESNCIDNVLDKEDFVPKKYKTKKLTFKELVKIALENDFICCRDKGDHQIFKHIHSSKIVVIPYKANTTAPIGTQRSILSMIFTPTKQVELVS